MLINNEIGINNLKININDFVYLLLLGTICTACFVWMVEIMKYISPLFFNNGNKSRANIQYSVSTDNFF